MCERLGKRREEDASIGVGSRPVDCAMQRDDCLAGARGTGDACWSTVVTLDRFPLRWVEKTAHFSQGYSNASASSSLLDTTRNRRSRGLAAVSR